MHVYSYSLTVRDDQGVVLIIKTAATSAAAARHIVCEAERCPPRAIQKVTRLKRIF